MKRKAMISLLILWLAISTLTAIEFTSLTKADPYVPPEEAPPGYRINSDGTYVAENLRRDGNVYTFTGDINFTIVIERDGIVLDGAGYTLQGNGSSAGIWLQDRSNVTIKNLNIRNFGYGIRFSHYYPNWYIPHQENLNFPTNCTIYANNITNNSNGISLDWGTSDCNILDNYIANNTHGITFAGSGNTLRNNRIEGNQYDFWDQDDEDNDVDTSNTIDGKPIYYWVNQHNMTVPDNAELVVLKRCSGIKVQNLSLTGHGNGLTIYYTNDSKISGNTISDNYWRGITLFGSYNNSIMGNQVTNNPSYGIYLYESDNNNISNNLIKGNSYGIEAIGSKNTVISSNQIIANQGGGMYSDSSNWEVTDNYIFGNLGIGINIGSNSTVARNNITQNKGTGIDFGSNCIIIDNCISKNDIGIWMLDGTGNTIMSNDIVENDRWAIRFHGPAQNNLIYHNNFIHNNNNSTQVFFNTRLYDPGANAWDDGVEGNYWSDYTSRYPDAQKVENSTTGNTPYYINENNQDNHPLLAPQEFAALELPSIQPPQEANPTPEPQPEPFPTTLVVALIASVAVIGVGLLVYFKRRNH